MEIVKINDSFFEQTKDLLVDLQHYIISIDKYNLNIISNDYREKYFAFMLDDCKNNQGEVFVALESNEVAGMVAGYIQNYTDRDKLDYSCPQKGIIAELIVNKKFRSNGIGTALVNHMENYFKSLGCEYIQLDVFSYNESAKQFYYKNGYEDRMYTLFKKI